MSTGSIYIYGQWIRVCMYIYLRAVSSQLTRYLAQCPGKSFMLIEIHSISILFRGKEELILGRLQYLTTLLMASKKDK